LLETLTPLEIRFLEKIGFLLDKPDRFSKPVRFFFALKK
jgi:hypothetical protein